MSSSDLIRWGGFAAMIGGVVWVLAGLLFRAIPESAVTDVLFIIAALCTVGGFVGFHALQKDNYGRIGRGGFWTVVVASYWCLPSKMPACTSSSSFSPSTLRPSRLGSTTTSPSESKP